MLATVSSMNVFPMKLFTSVDLLVMKVQYFESHGPLMAPNWSLYLMIFSYACSARIWEVHCKSRYSKDAGEVGLLFGHSARVWDCYISDNLIVTAGEDCSCRVWGLDGRQHEVIREHMKDGNSWSSGPAPPPPPGTPPASKPNHNKNSGSGNSPSNGDSGSGSKKSGIGGSGVAGIVISILLVVAVVAFFVVKRRCQRRLASDEEKLDNQPFAPLASSEVQEMKSFQTTSMMNTKFDPPPPASINLKPPPIDRHVIR
ncbi:protein STRUBBELIG-RECEPTOR FAMILY 7-like [Syzygium oleosum]|uniref:protein STRUBBELIG-RECEPTOR FAMILY 7-like n=1 Tax=Syzygium oleosum TaxID=219896 RepID=UPI0024B969F3|nr:protein STRUBBELIG-RECEPTOR FAMILY 7-like [Syzygium oleosum]